MFQLMKLNCDLAILRSLHLLYFQILLQNNGTYYRVCSFFSAHEIPGPCPGLFHVLSSCLPNNVKTILTFYSKKHSAFVVCTITNQF